MFERSIDSVGLASLGNRYQGMPAAYAAERRRVAEQLASGTETAEHAANLGEDTVRLVDARARLPGLGGAADGLQVSC
jgi:hypothetical protein